MVVGLEGGLEAEKSHFGVVGQRHSEVHVTPRTGNQRPVVASRPWSSVERAKLALDARIDFLGLSNGASTLINHVKVGDA